MLYDFCIYTKQRMDILSIIQVDKNKIEKRCWSLICFSYFPNSILQTEWPCMSMLTHYTALWGLLDAGKVLVMHFHLHYPCIMQVSFLISLFLTFSLTLQFHPGILWWRWWFTALHGWPFWDFIRKSSLCINYYLCYSAL